MPSAANTFIRQDEDRELERLHHSLRTSMALNLATQGAFFERDPKLRAEGLELAITKILRKNNVQVLERATLRLWKRKIVRYKRRIVHRVVQRMRSRVLSDAWQLLRTHAYEARRMYAKLIRAGARGKGRLIRNSFRAWRKHSVEQNRTRNILARIATRIMHKSMFAAWKGWQQRVQESHRHRTLLRRLVVRMTKRGMALAFGGWRQNSSLRRSVKRQLSRVAHRLTAKPVVLALALWRERVLEFRYMRASSLKVVSHWVKRTMACSLQAWKAFAFEARHRSNVISRIMKRMQNRHTSSALLRWTDRTHEAQRQQIKKARVLMRWTQKEKRLAFDAWSAGVDHQDSLSSWIEYVEKNISAKKEKWANATLARALRAWITVTSGGICKRRLLAKVSGRLMSGIVSLALSAWIDHVTKTRLARQNELRKLSIMDHVIKRMIYRTKSMVWGRWSDHVKEIRVLQAKGEREKLVVARVVKRMGQRVVSCAWGSWQEHVEASKHAQAEEARRQACMRRVVVRLSNALIASAFGRWRENAADVRALRAEEDRKFLVIARVVKRMVQDSLTCAWGRWIYQVQCGKRSRVIIKKVLARVARKRACQALDAWRWNARQVSILHRKGIKAARRWASMALIVVVEAWRVITAEQQRKRVTIVKTISRIKSRELYCCWNKWLVSLKQSKYEGEMMLQALGRSDGLDIAMQAEVLLQWSLFRARCLKVKHFEVRHGVRGVHRILLQWSSICWRNKSKRTVCTCIMMQHASETLALALRDWHWEALANRRSVHKLKKKWIRAWISSLQKHTLRCVLHDVQWRNMAVTDASSENMRRGMSAWRTLTSEACACRARFMQARDRACKSLRWDACLGWMHVCAKRRVLLRSQRLITRRRFASLSRKSIALWRMTIAWIVSLKLSIRTVIQSQIGLLIKRAWTAWRLGDAESQHVGQQWTRILLVCSTGVFYDRKTRGRIRAIRWAVGKRCYSDSCKRHFQRAFDGWKETVASYICDYHMRVPAMLGPGDVVVGVSTLYIVRRARRFILEWFKTVRTCHSHRQRALKATQLDRFRQRGVLIRLMCAWHQRCRSETLRQRVLSTVVRRKKARQKHHVMEGWWTAVRQRIRGKRIQMKMGIRNAGHVIERFLHIWRACKNKSYSMMQMHALVYHKCGMELEARIFHEWHARKRIVMQTVSAAWASLAVGLRLSTKDVMSSMRRPRTLASFIVNRTRVVSGRLRNKVMSIVVAWHVFTIYQNMTAFLSCQLTHMRSVRMRACMNIWKAARNYRAALNAPLVVISRARESRLSTTIMRNWQSTINYFKALCNVYRTTTLKTEHKLKARVFLGWRHVSHTNRVMHLKIRRSAEKCVKNLWVGIRIVWIHWIKVILAERRLLHTRKITRRRRVYACVRRHFACWRTIMFSKIFRGQLQPQKEMKSSSSRLLDGDAKQGYKVWNNDSSETDIDEDDDDNSYHGQNPSGDSGDSDGDDDFDDKASTQASSVRSDSAQPSSRPVYISERAKAPSFRDADRTHSTHVVNERLWLVAGSDRSPEPALALVPHVVNERLWRVAGSDRSPEPALALVPMTKPNVVIGASPSSVRFRRSPSPDRVPLSQHAIGWQTWVPPHERLTLIAATYSRRHEVRAVYSIFALWAADTQLALATTHRLSCILSLARQRILGGGSMEAACAAAPMLQVKNRARCVSLHFELWVDVVERQKWLQRHFSTLLSKSGRRCLGTCFIAWQRLQEGEKAKKRKALLILFHYNETALRRSFSTWKSWNRARIGLRFTIAKVAERMQLCRMRLCFEYWGEDAADKRTARRKSAAIMLDTELHIVAAHFLAWSHEAHVVACAGRKAQRKSARHISMHMRKILTRWYELVSKNRASRRRILRLMSRNNHYKFLLTWGAWRNEVQRAIELDNTGQRVRRRSGRRMLSNSFCKWLVMADDERRKKSRFSTAVSRKFKRCFFLVWRHFMGVTEVKGYSVAVAESRLHRFSRCLLMQRSLFSWHRLVMNGGEVRHAVKLAHFRRARKCFQDFRSFMAARALRTRLGKFLAFCCYRRRTWRAVEAWKEVLDTRGVPAPYVKEPAPYVVKERISDVYLSLSPYPKTFAPASARRF